MYCASWHARPGPCHAAQCLPASPLLRGSLQVQPHWAKARPQPSPRSFAIGPALQPPPTVMSAESSTAGNWLRWYFIGLGFAAIDTRRNAGFYKLLLFCKMTVVELLVRSNWLVLRWCRQTRWWRNCVWARTALMKVCCTTSVTRRSVSVHNSHPSLFLQQSLVLWRCVVVWFYGGVSFGSMEVCHE